MSWELLRRVTWLLNPAKRRLSSFLQLIENSKVQRRFGGRNPTFCVYSGTKVERSTIAYN